MLKTKIYILSLVALSILASSCGGLSVTQKRYSRGLNISLFRSKDEKPVAQKAGIALKKSNTKTPLTQTIKPATEPVLAENKSGNTNTENKTNGVVRNLKNEKRPVKKVFQTLREINKIKTFPSTLNTIQNNTENNESDVDFIILFILALFIPPLAVYLYFGELNIHFWINLILVLLWGGLYTSIGFFGIGLAVIHALLVIFGIFG